MEARLTDTPTATDALTVQRFFTTPGAHPFDSVEWELRDARIGHGDHVAFEQEGVEFPATWSQNATNIVAQKYFRGQLSSPERERSVKQMIGRVSGTIADWGRARAYFASDEDAEAFEAELTFILLHQLAAFNSPVWFNVGFEESPQCSACFILSVKDTMDSILDWNTKEGKIFLGGSGSGINLSNIRGSMEPLSKGGTASGPVSFMRGADAWAGTIKSGGKTRRAAKMVVLDIDHPDMREFITCKADEEEKAAALRDAGFDMSIDGAGFQSIQYQNANNSVRVTDEFMQAVENDGEWRLIARTTGKPVGDPIPARELMREIAKAAWRCADPGLQYDTTINRWHTCPESGRINASNPCSEYMHVDDSACNLASLNLMKFRRPDGTFDVPAFEHSVDVILLAQEIIVGPVELPDRGDRRQRARVPPARARLRQPRRLPDGERDALRLRRGPRDRRGDHRADDRPRLRAVGARGRDARALRALRGEPRPAQRRDADAPRRGGRDPRRRAARPRPARGGARGVAGGRRARRDARLPQRAGERARADRDDLVPDGLRHDRHRAGLLAGQVQGARRRRQDDDRQPHRPARAHRRSATATSRSSRSSRTSTSTTRSSGRPTSRTSTCPSSTSPSASARSPTPGTSGMMGAVQPFISGAISKTVNLPESATVQDIGDAYMEAWRLGIKALAIYRDGSKTAQALRTDAQKAAPADVDVDAAIAEALAAAGPKRRRMPRERQSITHKFSLGGHEGYITAGMYEDGTIGEIFLTDIGKEGSTLRGMMNAFATSISIALQYGVPLETLVQKFSYMRFEPEGITTNPEIPFAKSMPDYIMRWLASRFLDTDAQEELGILTPAVRARKAAQDVRDLAALIRHRGPGERDRGTGERR